MSAIWLIINFFALAGLYLTLHAQFIAVIQIIVYAGAIMVLFLFVIMLLNLGAVKPDKAAGAGLQATTNGLELAQKMVNYNNLAQELLAQLQTRLKKNGSPETRQRIEQIILRMNEEAEAVNDLNKRYQEEMREFDRLTGR